MKMMKIEERELDPFGLHILREALLDPKLIIPGFYTWLKDCALYNDMHNGDYQPTPETWDSAAINFLDTALGVYLEEIEEK